MGPRPAGEVGRCWAGGRGGLLLVLAASPTYDDNVFADVQAYAAAHIPAHAVVVTEETMGT